MAQHDEREYVQCGIAAGRDELCPGEVDGAAHLREGILAVQLHKQPARVRDACSERSSHGGSAWKAIGKHEPRALSLEDQPYCRARTLAEVHEDN